MKEILKNHSILYAEDDKALQATTVEYLKRFFKEVYVASDGQEALALYKKCQPHALLLDIDMPCVDGLSVAKQVRQSDEVIPIVMMTAFTDTDLLLEATELNLCTYLVKPVRASKFKEALEKISLKLEVSASHSVALSEEYVWKSDAKTLLHKEQTVNLSHKEQTLLALLMTHRKLCVSFEEIMATVWENDLDMEVSIDAVKYHVSQLRKKLPDGCIQSVYGRGYMFL
jgi:DNA-binding response OmpR family regulator